MYTIVVMSSNEGSVRQFSIGLWSLRFLYFLIFIMFVGALGSVGYGIHSRNQLQSIHTKSEQLKADLQSQHNQLQYLDEEMQGIRRMADMVRSVLGIDQEQGVLGQGGDSFDTEEADDNQQADSIFDSQPAVMAIQTDFTLDSPTAQISQLKNKIEPVYEQVKSKTQEIRETPSILPIQVPDEDSKTPSYWCSSGFGWRTHPLTKKRQFHRGLDISTRKGTPVIASANGVVTQVKKDRFLGNMVQITHKATGIKTQYGHLMKKHADGIRTGKKVERREIIGYVGNSGRTTGTHLHYGVYAGDSWQNPLEYIILIR
ncbi:MAG: M23 family metallopeptidase [Candidatus Poribacteria bacterium]|nr:M23 family metallopeptidase [Candidatus Poribacteria bacterium]